MLADSLHFRLNPTKGARHMRMYSNGLAGLKNAYFALDLTNIAAVNTFICKLAADVIAVQRIGQSIPTIDIKVSYGASTSFWKNNYIPPNMLSMINVIEHNLSTTVNVNICMDLESTQLEMLYSTLVRCNLIGKVYFYGTLMTSEDY